MSDDLGHYFEVAPAGIDPRRREAVAAVAPLLVADLGLAALGLRGGLVVKWFRPTTPMQFPVVLPGEPPPAGFVAARGLKGVCRWRDPDGVVWLHADLPLTPGKDGVLWALAHEAKHAQALLRPGRAWEVVGEGSCDVYAEQFLRRLQQKSGPAPTPPARADTWGPGHPNWRIPYQYTERQETTWPGGKGGPPGIEYSVGLPIGRVR